MRSIFIPKRKYGKEFKLKVLREYEEGVSFYSPEALDKYRIRSQLRIERYWLIMSLIHYRCCMYFGKYSTFEEEYQYFQNQVRVDKTVILIDL